MDILDWVMQVLFLFYCDICIILGLIAFPGINIYWSQLQSKILETVDASALKF